MANEIPASAIARGKSILDAAEWGTSGYHEFISRLPAITKDPKLVSLIGKHSFVTMTAFEIDDYASAIKKGRNMAGCRYTSGRNCRRKPEAEVTTNV